MSAFRRHDQWLSVFIARGSWLSDAARMDKLAGFQPGSTPALTAIAVGKPSQILKPKAGEEYWVYENEHGKFWVGAEESADGSRAFPLYFFPYDTRPDAFLSQVVLKRARPDAEDERIMIFECGVAQPSLQVLLKSGRVYKVVWSSITDLVLRSDPNQCTD